MAARHTIEPDAERVPGVDPQPRRGAMYMRAEARHAAETAGVAVASPRPARRRDTRRIQLAVLAAIWVLIAGFTMVLGLRWVRQDTSSPLSKPGSVVAAQRPSTPAPQRVAVTTPPAVAPAPPARVQAFTPKPAELPATSGSTPTPVAKAAAVVHPVPAAKPVALVKQPVTRPAPASAPRLVVASTPPGAVVTVDGIGWGATPARIRYLPPGTKRVRVTKEGYAAQETLVRVGDAGAATLTVVLRPLGAAAAGRR